MQNNIQWYPGHMTKTRRLIEANLKLIDVVVEILDARLPFSGRNPAFDDILKSKPRLLVMNKADLADKAKTDEWIRWYKANGLSVIPISCTTGAGVNKIISSSRELIKDKLEREKERGRNRNLSIMMAGIPNVGKSSLINRLCGRASAKTGDKAGVTRGKQWIRLRDGTELFDTPGMLPPKFENQETEFVKASARYCGISVQDFSDTVNLKAVALSVVFPVSMRSAITASDVLFVGYNTVSSVTSPAADFSKYPALILSTDEPEW